MTQAGNDEMPDREIDARGLKCPLPLLQLKLAINQMPAGQQVRLLTTDPGSLSDVARFCEMAGHQLCQEQMADGSWQHWVCVAAPSITITATNKGSWQ